jgi:hypothetical protein
MKSSLRLSGVPLLLAVALPLCAALKILRFKGSPSESLSLARTLILTELPALTLAASPDAIGSWFAIAGSITTVDVGDGVGVGGITTVDVGDGVGVGGITTVDVGDGVGVGGITTVDVGDGVGVGVGGITAVGVGVGYITRVGVGNGMGKIPGKDTGEFFGSGIPTSINGLKVKLTLAVAVAP